MRTYIKPEFEVTSIFAQENIASIIPYSNSGAGDSAYHPDGGSSIYIENSGDKGGWDLWD